MLRTITLSFIFAFVVSCTPKENVQSADSTKPRATSNIEVGKEVPYFLLKGFDEKSPTLNDLTKDGPLILIVLRGWPGYQCPACSRQARDFIMNADNFRKANAKIAMVYPGPNQQLMTHASQFLEDKNWPQEYVFLLDPDYSMISSYGVRWNAESETSYPSTFIIGKDTKLKYKVISETHGGRTKAKDVLDKLSKLD